MHSPIPSNSLPPFSRRGFLQLLAAASAATLSSQGVQAQQQAPYKASVCVFLHGGIDQSSFLIPADPQQYANYNAIRSSISYANPSELHAVSFNTPRGSGAFYLPPGARGAQELWSRGYLSSVANVGTLLVPTTLNQYYQRSVPLPEKLFSHNDQQAIWQSGELESEAANGYGAKFLEELQPNPFSCISVSGRSVYLNSDSLLQFQVSPSGPNPLATDTYLYGSSSGAQVAKDLLRTGTNEPFARTLATQNAGALVLNEQLKSALLTATLPVAMPNTHLGRSLGMVAKLILCAPTLGVSRQSFFVALGGFDMHDYLLRDFAPRMFELWDALWAFEQNLVSIGAAKNVLTYTSSDFGRNTVSNGDGSDHGWGSHQFIISEGASRRQFGMFPEMALNNATDIGNGALLPSSSHEQLMAMCARFMGISEADILRYLPYSGNFEAWRW